VVVNPAFVWLERQTGRVFCPPSADEEVTPAWDEINQLVLQVGSLLEMEVPTLTRESELMPAPGGHLTEPAILATQCWDFIRLQSEFLSDVREMAAGDVPPGRSRAFCEQTCR